MAKKGLSYAPAPKRFHIPADLKPLTAHGQITRRIQAYVNAVNTGRVRTPGFDFNS